MDQLAEQLFSYIDRRAEECGRQELALIGQSRKDEANLFKIRGNIFGIYRTLLQSAIQQAQREGGESDSFCRIFELKAEKLPHNWQLSYEKAKTFQDAARILVEEEKLAAASEIMEYYKKLKEACTDD